MGVKAFRKIQFGIETTAGTEVNASVLWRGIGVPNDDLKLEYTPEDIGYLSGIDRTYIASYLGGLDLEATPATFQQLPYILTSGVKALTTGVADGVGSGKIYAYPFPITAANTISNFTIEGGDDAGEEQMLYGFTKSFKLTGKPEEALMMSATMVGRQLAPGTFTAAVAVPTVQDILFNKGKLYIDAIGSTIGTTVKANTFLGFELNVDTGWQPVRTADGELYYSFLKQTSDALKVTAQVTFEHDAIAVAQKGIWRAQTPIKLRTLFEGNTLTTAGAFTKYSLQIDMAGKWTSFDKIGENNGNDTVVGNFQANYDATGAMFATITVVNESTTL